MFRKYLGAAPIAALVFTMCFMLGMLWAAGKEETPQSSEGEVYILIRCTSEKGEPRTWVQQCASLDDLKKAVARMKSGKERDYDRNIPASELEEPSVEDRVKELERKERLPK